MAGKPKSKVDAGKQKPEKEDFKEKGIGGAKSKYNDDFPLLAEGYARRGLSDSQIASNLGISCETYYSYQRRFPEFLDAIKKGKAPVDIAVENALLKNALGFEYEEVHTEITKNGDKQNVKKKIITKKQPPNLGAQIFWLINRLPELWKQRKDEEQRDNMEEIKATLAEFVKAL